MKKPKMFSVLPTLLTLGNAACGFGAITFAAKVGPETDVGNEFFIAALLIFLAMVFDMLDGSAARWTKQTSEFGAQLDSLCDALSFGVAPAFLMLQFTRHDHSFGGQLLLPFDYHPRPLWMIGVLFVICALLRLARFNVETEEDDSHEYFSGLPSPAAAGTVAAFPIAMHGLKDLMAPTADATLHTVAEWLILTVKISLPLITLAVACLMVSRVRYAHVFNQLFLGHRNRQHLIQLVFTMAVVFVVKEMVVPLIFCYFAFAAPLRALWKEVVSRRLYKSSGV
jgi:CDP-diacylglycerol--serine O-phosphatidyltransferase